MPDKSGPTALDYIGVGGSIGTSLLGMVHSDLAAQEQFSRQKELMKLENDYAISQWHRENEYNLPINQVQRLKDAGLNPALMYDNGASGLVSGNVSNPTSGGNVSKSDFHGAVLDPLTFAQIRNINADTEKKEIETEDTRVHVDWQRGQIKVGETVVLYNKALASMTSAQQKLIEGQTDFLATQTEKFNSEIAKNYADIQNMTILQRQRWAEIALRSKEVDSSCAKMAAETGYTLEQTKYVSALAMAKVYNLRSDTSLNKARENLTNKQALECEQVVENLKVENGQMSWTLEMDQKYADTERDLKIRQGIVSILESASNSSGIVQGSYKYRMSHKIEDYAPNYE